ncbi:unnamed protein product [Rotaria sordida]|uniref:Autophagy-related protein 27 n=1 Tax=Rotaria sordida TaxID=392033 RepID=A0A815N2X7_9BILA|nr:unnamed protein product [Rotaria sordida]CAF1006685.1 unnamed protein product [Rotaria sordida]CAF1427757.1 unnamed protein product [Rotaria sordida]CAF3554365.1 unnamed protein product [Rotaria sordida]
MIVSSILISIILNIYTIKADDCEYSTPDGILDLKTLGYKDRPKYNNIPDTGLHTIAYSFNGCFAYSTKDTCQNAAACVIDLTSKQERLIARQTDRVFTYNVGVISIIYTDGDDTTLRVFLLCKTTESFQAHKITDNSFLFNIESECACPGKCTYIPDKPSGHLTGGAVFIIVLLCIIATYLIISILFLRLVKHEQGINLIPNRTLWLQIGHDTIQVLLFIVKMFVPILNLFIYYLFMLIIQTIASESSCVYDVGSGQKLDIRTLGYENGKGPKYDNIPNSSPTKSTLSWNGCFSYSKSDGGNCKDAAACSTSTQTGMSTVIAKQSEVQFEHHDNVNLLIYQTVDRLLAVFLTCSDSDEDTVNGHQDDAQTFSIYVQSRCCCPDKCHYSPDSGSISGGAIFLILLISILFVYIIGGIMFLKYARGATGSDMIPNRLIWLNITLYALDGLRYSIQIIRHRSFNIDYQKI